MTITTGDTLPDASVLTMGADGPQSVAMADKLKGRTVVIFGLPGAYTGTCTTAHVPSFIRTLPQLKDKGVDEVICISVNDPFVMKAWGDATGAIDAGI
ncbi:MAG: redoxin family protein, partial [Alphaproteobacteria bacterium]|nr:redoxin family protein [Alphaproteobacteria bacterium]